MLPVTIAVMAMMMMTIYRSDDDEEGGCYWKMSLLGAFVLDLYLAPLFLLLCSSPFPFAEYVDAREVSRRPGR